MDNDILKRYKIMIEFLSEILSDNFEIVLHDLRQLEHSITAIKNGHVSGRKKGDPSTDFVLKTIKENNSSNYKTNYKGQTKNGQELRSSSLFIRNEQEEIIGMLCINIDIDAFVETKNILDQLIGKNKTSETNDCQASEKFTNSINDLVDTILNNTMNKYKISPERMTPEEKKQIVHELDQKGVFLLKNSISNVANELKTSDATIYRYLNDK
jgi:predicted transcriptional regulator YheO